MVRKKKETQENVTTQEPVVIESAPTDDKLRTGLEEIRKYDGVVGYIAKDAQSAIINVNDPAKIVEYAILSSTAFETAEEFSRLFETGAAKTITVSGKDLRMLSLTIDEIKISIFMEKNADSERITKRIQAS